MKIERHKTKIFGRECEVELMGFDKGDRKKLKELFSAWKKLTSGMKDFGCRGINIPEGISEPAFCLFSGSKRFVRMIKKDPSVSGSFDTFNLKTGKAEQVKACSVKGDLTSFGPKSKWDDLYFVDFYNDGKLDGAFDVYRIPNKLIEKTSVNKNQSFSQQQIEKRRPRFSIKKDIIDKYEIKPIAKKVRVW